MTGDTIHLLLASDVDDTLLSYDQVISGELLSVVSKLLALRSIKLAVITGNDYIHLQRRRIVEPIPAELRKDLIVYADGCTRKLTFTDEGQEVLNKAYHSEVEFDRGDKTLIQEILHRKVQEWCRRYPGLDVPSVHIESSGEKIQIKVGPLEASETSSARRDELCKRVKAKLEELCVGVQVIPSDVLWMKARCESLREGISLDHLEQSLRQMIKCFAGLSTPVVVDREEQLALKPIRPQFRPDLAREIGALVSGKDRRTNKEYSALIGGRATIDIQRMGIDKAFAIRNLREPPPPFSGHILYFGNAFGPNGNDRPLAFVKKTTCISVGSTEEGPENVIKIGGGPPATLAYLRGILWALSGQTS